MGRTKFGDTPASAWTIRTYAARRERKIVDAKTVRRPFGFYSILKQANVADGAWLDKLPRAVTDRDKRFSLGEIGVTPAMIRFSARR